MKIERKYIARKSAPYHIADYINSGMSLESMVRGFTHLLEDYQDDRNVTIEMREYITDGSFYGDGAYLSFVVNYEQLETEEQAKKRIEGSKKRSVAAKKAAKNRELKQVQEEKELLRQLIEKHGLPENITL